MRLRSLLFVPGDRPERFAKAAASGADAIILDLEDSVSLANKDAARHAIADYLAGAREVFTLVRVNPLDGHLTAADVAAIIAARPDAIMLPKAEGAPSIAQLDTDSAQRMRRATPRCRRSCRSRPKPPRRSSPSAAIARRRTACSG